MAGEQGLPGRRPRGCWVVDVELERSSCCVGVGCELESGEGWRVYFVHVIFHVRLLVIVVVVEVLQG